MSFERSGSRASGAKALVVDASVAIKASLVEHGFDVLRSRRLAAPSLMWSEAAAGLRQLEWRGEISLDEARRALDRLLALTVESHPSAHLVREAGTIARQLGWAKTYDAEYVALARHLDTALVTLDARLRRGATNVVPILGPTDIAEYVARHAPDEVTDALNEVVSGVEDAIDPFVDEAAARILKNAEEGQVP
jgi:predicted nucleic acid-binding protein